MIALSFIIPVYNAEKYLQECLDSITCQTLKNIEIICINDGSKDSSLAILENAAAKDERIKIFSVPNAGVSAARNLGMSHARGEYIWFVDADDYISDVEAAKKVYEKGVSTDSDIVLCSYYIFNVRKNTIQSSNYLKKYIDVKDGSILTELKEKRLSQPAMVWFKIFKRNFIDLHDFSFDTSISFGEDGVFSVKCMMTDGKISFVHDNLYVYRTLHGSVCDEYSSYFVQNFNVIHSILMLLNKMKASEIDMISYVCRVIKSLLYWKSRVDHNKQREFYEMMRNLFMMFNKEYGDGIQKYLEKSQWKRFLKVVKRPYWLQYIHELFHRKSYDTR